MQDLSGFGKRDAAPNAARTKIAEMYASRRTDASEIVIERPERATSSVEPAGRLLALHHAQEALGPLQVA
jgi:hypothetical protein